MARYDVSIVLTMHYSFAVEAPNPLEAQGEAFTLMPVKDADRVDTTVEVERGAR